MTPTQVSVCGEPQLGTVCTTARCDDEQRCDVSSEWDAVVCVPYKEDGTCVSAVSRGVYCRHVSCRRFCCALVHFARNCSACSLRSSPGGEDLGTISCT